MTPHRPVIKMLGNGDGIRIIELATSEGGLLFLCIVRYIS